MSKRCRAPQDTVYIAGMAAQRTAGAAASPYAMPVGGMSGLFGQGNNNLLWWLLLSEQGGFFK